MFSYIKPNVDNPNRIHIRSGEYNQNTYGYFFQTPGGNWFYQPDATRELTYLELRRLYNKLYELNKGKKKKDDQ